MAHVRRELALGVAALLASAIDAAQQDCSVDLWWGGFDHVAKNDCDGDPRLEDINCINGLNTLLKAVPTTAVGTVTHLVTGQDAAQLAFKTATGKDVPAFCDEVCTKGCYSGFWFHSPCILDAGKTASTSTISFVSIDTPSLNRRGVAPVVTARRRIGAVTAPAFLAAVWPGGATPRPCGRCAA